MERPMAGVRRDIGCLRHEDINVNMNISNEEEKE